MKISLNFMQHYTNGEWEKPNNDLYQHIRQELIRKHTHILSLSFRHSLHDHIRLEGENSFYWMCLCQSVSTKIFCFQMNFIVIRIYLNSLVTHIKWPLITLITDKWYFFWKAKCSSLTLFDRSYLIFNLFNLCICARVCVYIYVLYRREKAIQTQIINYIFIYFLFYF